MNCSSWDLCSLHNHMSQFLTINLFIYLSIYMKTEVYSPPFLEATHLKSSLSVRPYSLGNLQGRILPCLFLASSGFQEILPCSCSISISASVVTFWHSPSVPIPQFPSCDDTSHIGLGPTLVISS